MKTQVLKVVSIVENEDKNGKKYRTITVSTPPVVLSETEVGVQAIHVKPRFSAFNAWEESYLKSMKGNADFGYNLTEGDTIQGTIVKRTCMATLRDEERNILGFADSYVIVDPETNESRSARSYSAVVLADSADASGFEQAIRDAFWQADRPLADDPRVMGFGKPALLADPKEVGVKETA